MPAPGATALRHRRFAAFVFAAFLFLAAVVLGLLVPVFSGLLFYALVMHAARHIALRGASDGRSRLLAALSIALVAVASLVAGGIGLHFLFRNGAGIHELLAKTGDILSTATSALPAWITAYIPQQGDLLPAVGNWLKTHAPEVGSFGLGALKLVGYAIVGGLLGILIALSEMTRRERPGPVSRLLLQQLIALRESFWRVASAQLRISAINTCLTGIYLLVVLPLFGVHLPMARTLVALTFVTGLLPIVGNLVSNSVITIISFSLSLDVALASLVFLVLVHKLEYFVNARIVGSQIHARAWEILLWMLLMERLFGPAGVAAAPVFYAWLKSEWRHWDRPRPALPQSVAASAPAAVEPAPESQS